VCVCVCCMCVCVLYVCVLYVCVCAVCVCAVCVCFTQLAMLVLAPRRPHAYRCNIIAVCRSLATYPVLRRGVSLRNFGIYVLHCAMLQGRVSQCQHTDLYHLLGLHRKC
jgi:hypothetical protein